MDFTGVDFLQSKSLSLTKKIARFGEAFLLFLRIFLSLLPRPSLRPFSQAFRRFREARKKRHLLSYQYDAILSTGQIRLLKIDQWSCGLLYCTLESVPLANCPRYTALSYTWQPEDPKARNFFWFILTSVLARTKISRFDYPDDSEPKVSHYANRLIICNDRAFLVTQNLYDGLTSIAFSYESTERYWWVDQVCINQSSKSEKNLQVPLMGEIYRNASTVAVWLGLGSSWETQPLGRIQTQLDGPPNGDLTDWRWALNSSWLLLALANVIKRSWFQRVWIVQELVLARKVVFFLGSHSIQFDDLYNLTGSLSKYVPCIGVNRALSEMFGFPVVFELLSYREYFQTGHVWEIEEWISAIRGHIALDGRDYIYAGLSLLSDSERSKIDVDYGRTREEIFGDVTRYFLLNHLGINALSLAERGDNIYSSPPPNRPTWEVNADCPTSRAPMSKLGKGLFKACPPSVQADFNIDGQLLRTKTLLVDQVDIVCSESLLETGNGIEDLLQIILKMGEQYHWTGQEPLVAIAMTVAAGAVSPSEPLFDDIAQNLVTMIATLVELYQVKSKAAKDSPLDSFSTSWPYYHNYDWKTTWISPQSYLHYGIAASIIPISVEFSEAVTTATRKRRLFVTQKGIIGLGPITMERGQTIAIVAGGHIPYVLNSVDIHTLDWKLSLCYSKWDRRLMQRAKLIGTSNPAIASAYEQCISIDTAYVEWYQENKETASQATLRRRYEDTQHYFRKNIPTEDKREIDKIKASMQLVGEAYLHGFMNGEVEKLMKKDNMSWQFIDLQ